MSSGRRFPSPAARAESGGGGPDLTPPLTPTPQVLTSGTTSLGSTSIGSWSDTVTVAATVTASSGSPPTATVTGSGAGPYSVSIASGLADGRAYAVRLRGTSADGQVADVVLAVVVEAAAAADLTPPATPTPQVLASGTTSLGSTSIGSWSASVTVTATVSASAGSPPTATVSGSGAGPYSVSIASGLADGVTYAVRLRGTGADGQVADVVLSLAVATAAPAPAWGTLAEYDLTTVDTATAVTATGGDVALTVGGAAFLTLKTVFGSGTGSLTPTNGQGVIFSGSGGGIRAAFLNIDWAAIGASLDTDTIAVMAEFGFTSMVSGGTLIAFAATTNANANSNHNFGGRWSLSGATYSIAPRYYNSASNIGAAVSSGTTAFSGNYSAAMIIGPGGQTTYMHAGALPADPTSFGLGPRRYSQPVSTWTANSLTFPAGPPKPAFWVEDAVAVWRKIRIMRWS